MKNGQNRSTIFMWSSEYALYYNSGRVTKDGVEIEPARPYEESIRKMEQEKYELYGR